MLNSTYTTIKNLFFKPLQKNIQHDYALCMIITEEEDAKIYIDSNYLGKRTPSLIRIIKNKKTLLTLKKNGYEDYHTILEIKKDATFFYTKLKKKQSSILKIVEIN